MDLYFKGFGLSSDERWPTLALTRLDGPLMSRKKESIGSTWQIRGRLAELTLLVLFWKRTTFKRDSLKWYPS
jgi:hypothetical protein